MLEPKADRPPRGRGNKLLGAVLILLAAVCAHCVGPADLECARKPCQTKPCPAACTLTHHVVVPYTRFEGTVRDARLEIANSDDPLTSSSNIVLETDRGPVAFLAWGAFDTGSGEAMLEPATQIRTFLHDETQTQLQVTHWNWGRLLIPLGLLIALALGKSVLFGLARRE